MELTSALISMLLLRIKGAGPSLESVILTGIADLAIHVDQQGFKDIISTFTSINKNISLELSAAATEAVFQLGIYRAQIKLSKALLHRDDLCEIYLVELLKLFIAKGQRIQTTHAVLPSFSQLVNHLGVLIPAIGNLLHSTSSYDPRRTKSADISELFRNFWYICVLFGFLSSSPLRATHQPTTSPPDWLIDSLRQIATKSPTLTHLTPIDYVTTQLDYNPILKFPEASNIVTPTKLGRYHNPAIHGQSSNQLAVEQEKKQELANLIPTHSGQVKGFNFIQTMFLLTVARLEIFRAEDCRASNILEYLRHVPPDEVEVNNLFGCLVTISEKVCCMSAAKLVNCHVCC